MNVFRLDGVRKVGGGSPADFVTSTRYTDAADLASNGPAATGSGSYVLVDDGEAGRPRVYRDGGSWSPVNDAAAYASYSAAKADIANIGAGDYVVTPVGMYFVAESGSRRVLLPALPFGPTGGLLTAATGLSLWEASGDNTDFGDFSKDIDAGTTSITDDGSTITLSIGGASATGRLLFADAAPTSSDTRTIFFAEDFEITALSGDLLTSGANHILLEARSYAGASESNYGQASATPVSVASNWRYALEDSGDATQTGDSLVALPDGGSSVDIAVAADGTADRLWSLTQSDTGYPAVADLNGAARSLSDRQSRQLGSASTLTGRIQVGTNIDNGTVTAAFSSVSTWRLTLA